MNPALLLATPLVLLALAVLTAVASLPALLLAAPVPRLRLPSPLAVAGPPLDLVRAGSGTWFVAGQPMAERALAQLLQQRRGSAVEVVFHPSSALDAASVSQSLAWLRRQSGRPVALALPRGPTLP